jgi:hypothetical protein
VVDKYKVWGQRLLKTYGITAAQYDELLKKQEECCAICHRHYTSFQYRLCVDHDHASKEIRGLLCYYCNRRLVGRHRDAALLRTIAFYVEQGTGWFVPTKKRKKRK